MIKQYGILALWVNFFGILILLVPLFMITPLAGEGVNRLPDPVILSASLDSPVNKVVDTPAAVSSQPGNTVSTETSVPTAGPVTVNEAAVSVDSVAKPGDLVVGPKVTAISSSGKTRLNISAKARGVKTIPAPDFKLTTLDGRNISLSDLKGKNVMINFWASWCGPCTHEMPQIQAIYDKISEDDLIVLTVNYQEAEDIVREYVKDSNTDVPVLLDPSGEVCREYNVFSIPRTYFVNPEGSIYAVKFGGFETSDEILDYLK